MGHPLYRWLDLGANALTTADLAMGAVKSMVAVMADRLVGVPRLLGSSAARHSQNPPLTAGSGCNYLPVTAHFWLKPR